MKRFLLIISMAVCSLSSYAQALLLNTLKPTEQQHYSASDSRLRISGHNFNDSFLLNGPDGGLIASQEQSFVSFDLRGQYEKLSFVLGPAIANPNGDNGMAILVVTADGKTILDEIVNPFHHARRCRDQHGHFQERQGRRENRHRSSQTLESRPDRCSGAQSPG